MSYLYFAPAIQSGLLSSTGHVGINACVQRCQTVLHMVAGTLVYQDIEDVNIEIDSQLIFYYIVKDITVKKVSGAILSGLLLLPVVSNAANAQKTVENKKPVNT